MNELIQIHILQVKLKIVREDGDGNNLCKIKLATVKSTPRKIGHAGNNGQQRKLKLAAAIIGTVLFQTKLISNSELCCQFCIEQNLENNFREMGKSWKQTNFASLNLNQGIKLA